MSQENVEVVRAIHALWSSDESADHLIDPDVEYVNPSYAVESRWFNHPSEALKAVGLEE